MPVSAKNAFSFTWKIEDFSMCPLSFKENIKSPSFVVDGTEWGLRIYPRGDVAENYITCYLKRIESSDQDDPITVGFEIIAQSMHQRKNVRFAAENYIFRFDHSKWGAEKFCQRKEILHTLNGFLPNDTLTIVCRIWKRTNEKGNVPTSPDVVAKDSKLRFSDPAIQAEMSTSAARDMLLDFHTQFASSHFFARSRLPVSRKCIIWPIRGFASLRPDQRLSIPVITTNTPIPSFAMTLYLSGESVDEQNVQIEIRIENHEWCFVRCRITAITGLMKAEHVAEDGHLFEVTKPEDVWKFPTFLRMTTLIKEKYLDATQGTLYLRCEFAFCNEVYQLYSEGYESVPFLDQLPEPDKEELNNVQSMCRYDEGQCSDVTLGSGARTFKAHKCTLSSRSPVFRARFETDMLGSESGVLDITDHDPDTVEELLAFIYTNRVEDLQQEKAMKLYSVAAKYEVLRLKWLCSKYLKSTLSISNVCEVLTLADMHHDTDLLDHIQNFIQPNSDVILRSRMWKDLMRSNGSLASRVLLDLLTGKMGRLFQSIET